MRFKGITFRRAPAIVWRYPTEEEREADGGGTYVRIGRCVKPGTPGAEVWPGWHTGDGEPCWVKPIPLTYSRTNMGWDAKDRVYCVVDGYAYTAPPRNVRASA